MNEDFVPFELAVKLKEKGFECMYPIAMYNEKGVFHELYTSVGNMQYYDYDDFDEHDTIAPTISQALKWLREEKKIHISIDIWGRTWGYDVLDLPSGNSLHWDAYNENINSYEQAALAGIEYALNNLI